jgi:hypothetical protein
MSVPFAAIEQTLGVFEVKVTGRPDVAVAEDENAPPPGACGATWAGKFMLWVCVARSRLKE